MELGPTFWELGPSLLELGPTFIYLGPTLMKLGPIFFQRFSLPLNFYWHKYSTYLKKLGGSQLFLGQK